MTRKRSKSLIWFLCTLIIITTLILTSACATKTTTSTTQAVQYYDIGSLQPMTGFGAGWGTPSNDGILLAAKQINDAGGFTVNGQKYQLRVHVYDDGDMTKEVAGATQLAQAGCKVIFYCGGEPAAVQAVTEPLKIPLIMPGITTETMGNIKYSFTDQAAEIGSNFYASIISPPGGNTQITGVRTIGIITENMSTDIACLPGFIANVQAKGIKVVFNETADSTTTDFTALIAKLKQANPDLLFVNSIASATFLNLYPQMAADNYYPQTLEFDGIISRPADAKKIAGPGANGTIEYMMDFPGNLQAPDWANTVMAFDPVKRAAYTKGMADNYPGNDTGGSLKNYDFVNGVIYAIQKVGFDPDKIVAQMTSGDIYHGAGGLLQWFPQNHKDPMTMVLVRIVNINAATGDFKLDFIGGGNAKDYTYNTWDYHIETQIDLQKTPNRQALVNAP